MGALRSEFGQSSPLDAAELQTRSEISVLEDLRNAAQGGPLLVGPIINHAEDLARRGLVERCMDLMEVAATYRASFTKEDYDIFRLARAKLQATLRIESRTAVGDLESLVNDEESLVNHRVEALIRLAEISATNGDFRAATAILTPRGGNPSNWVYGDPEVILMRATYSVFFGDTAAALDATKTLLDTSSGLTLNQVRQVRVQHAWALTQAGRFDDSSKFIHDSVDSLGENLNVLQYIDAWNRAGAKNISLREALRGSLFTLGARHHESGWSQSFFRACSAFAENNLDGALEIFSSLPSGPEIEPTLNGTLHELALLGKAHTLLELGDHEGAYDAFHQLSATIPAGPVGARVQIIISAQRYGQLSAKFNTLSAIDTVSAARRCAHVSLGLASPLVLRLLDIEADLLLAAGRSAEARASRFLALEVIDKGAVNAPEEMLSHELGLYLIAAHENRRDEAHSGLRLVIPKIQSQFGNNHEKVFIARYALATLTDPNDPAGMDQTVFETLYEDLVKTFGRSHLLSLKASYGLAHRLSYKGQVSEALVLYSSIEAHLPDLRQNMNFKVSIHRRIGDSYRQLKQYEAAQTAYSSALESLQKSINFSTHRELEIQLDIHECLVKLGQYRQCMNFFSTTASVLREKKSETTLEYFRAVHGYASCLELLHNYEGSAHNYGHLVRLMDEGIHSKEHQRSAQIYAAAAWNNELSKNFSVAAYQYEKALIITKECTALNSDGRRVAELEHRLLCCSARLSA